MRVKRVTIAALVVGAVAGGAAACNSLLGIQGGTPRPPIVQLAAGTAFACALLADGSVWCWGADDHQQLGHLGLDADVPCTWEASDGGTNVGLCSPTPTQVAGLSGVTQIAVGNDFACALLGNGEVHCWGSNDQGQLGPLAAGDFMYSNCPSSFFEAGTARGATQCTPVPKLVTGIPNATAITAGSVHACASTPKGVYCWGYNGSGILDNPTTGLGPVRAMDVPPALQLAAPLADPTNAQDDNTCALISAKSTICWGPNNAYDDGCDGGAGVCNHATSGVASVHLGVDYGCALGVDGSLDCWGQNSFFTFDSTNPGLRNAVPTPSDYTQVLRETDNATTMLFDGRFTHVLVVDQSSALWGWGDNTYGQLGTDPVSSNTTCFSGYGHCSNVPIPVNLGDAGPVSAIATGAGFSLAVTSGGTVWAWGANTEGQLGHVSEGGPCVKLDAGAAPCDWVPSAIQVPP